ncbi:hypothetical protein LINGRAHAP2_LOCUS4488, partial [Linum grandiflorum]
MMSKKPKKNEGDKKEMARLKSYLNPSDRSNKFVCTGCNAYINYVVGLTPVQKPTKEISKHDV